MPHNYKILEIFNYKKRNIFFSLLFLKIILIIIYITKYILQYFIVRIARNQSLK